MNEQKSQETTGLLAVSYLRVSTKEQADKDGDAEGYSIPAQRDANRRKAAALGASIIAEFVDRGESARSSDRPELQRMLLYVRENPITFAIVHKVDRLARNRADDVEINLALKGAGVTLVSSTENIDETPSGMLLHGIMSSIAEFYSRNLATEVVKGMSQKAKSGGTPNRAPLGYRNVRELSVDGREVRTVQVDSERGPLISWAFKTYASGQWSLKQMTEELESRGLTTVRTPKLPARAVRPNVLHGILTNPYYKGDVLYAGVTYQGRHTPLVDARTWQQVQDVLASRKVGEKQRDHRHYLKSSVFCGDCDSRLIVTNARNRQGVVYPYFVCLGRHQKRTDCTRKALLISAVERMVEDHWKTVQLTPSLREAVEREVLAELGSYSKQAEAEHAQLATTRTKLLHERRRLLDAVYAGAVPLDMIREEQARITGQLTVIEEKLNATTAKFETIKANLTMALDLVTNCHRAYLNANDHLRRLFNQAFFVRLEIVDDGLHAELAPPFDVLLASNAKDAGGPDALQDQSGNGVNLTAALRTTQTYEKSPRSLQAAGALLVRPSSTVFGAEGLNMQHLVRVRRL